MPAAIRAAPNIEPERVDLNKLAMSPSSWCCLPNSRVVMRSGACVGVGRVVSLSYPCMRRYETNKVLTADARKQVKPSARVPQMSNIKREICIGDSSRIIHSGEKPR